MLGLLDQHVQFGSQALMLKPAGYQGRYPGLSSAQIENLARRRLSDQPLAPGISQVR